MSTNFGRRATARAVAQNLIATGPLDTPPVWLHIVGWGPVDIFEDSTNEQSVLWPMTSDIDSIQNAIFGEESNRKTLIVSGMPKRIEFSEENQDEICLAREIEAVLREVYDGHLLVKADDSADDRSWNGKMNLITFSDEPLTDMTNSRAITIGLE